MSSQPLNNPAFNAVAAIYNGIAVFIVTFWRGTVIVSRSREFEFRVDRMRGFGWNYYVFHCGVVSIWVSDALSCSTKKNG